MNVVVRYLRDRQRSFLWWVAGVAFLVLFTVALFPSVRGQTSFEEVYDDLPEALKAMFGTFGDVPITSAPGYLQGRLFGTMLPLVLLIFGIGLATKALAASEEDGTLELLLSNPVTRRRVFVERYLACVALVGVLTLDALVSLFLFGSIFGALDGVRLVDATAATFAAGTLALLHATIAFAVGAITGRPTLALSSATIVAVAGYLAQGLLSVSSTGRSLRVLSPWHWYLGRPLLVDGPGIAAFAIPLGLIAAFLLAGDRRFEVRDLR